MSSRCYFCLLFVCFACLFYKRKLYLIETKRRQREELKQVKVVSRWVFFFQSLCVFLWIFYRKAHQDAKYACIIYKLKLENFPPYPGQDIEKDRWVLSERETRIWDIGPTIILFWVKGKRSIFFQLIRFLGVLHRFQLFWDFCPLCLDGIGRTTNSWMILDFGGRRRTSVSFAQRMLPRLVRGNRICVMF